MLPLQKGFDRSHAFFVHSPLMRLLVVVLAILLPVVAFSFDPNLDPTAQADKGTRFCLGCHDGSVVPSVVNAGHPIDIDYLQAQMLSRGKLKNIGLLDPAIKLDNGLVGCPSCHISTSQLQSKVVMPTVGSQLCFGCHLL